LRAMISTWVIFLRRLCFKKKDIRHSLFVGIGAGATLGVLVGIVAHNVVDSQMGGLLLGSALIGSLLGAWGASMVGIMAPNTELTQFDDELDKGKLLMIVDVPKQRADEIEKHITKLHPDVRFKGQEPTIPSFP